MLASLNRTISNGITKVTYDPNNEKQMADEKKRSREARTKLRDAIDTSAKDVATAIKDTTITPQGATFVSALIQKANEWLSENPEALEPELLDKLYALTDGLASAYNDDSNRLYYYNIITFWEATVLQLLNQNKIASDKGAKLNKLIAEDKSWYSTNPNESMETYQKRINEFEAKAVDIISDPEIMKPIKISQENIKKIKNTSTVDDLIQSAKDAKKDKETLDNSTFSASRVAGKIASETAKGIGIAFFIVMGLIGGALVSNDAIVRPLSIRILYFIYGFIFSIPVLLYYLVRKVVYNKSPHYAASLLPLFETKEPRNTFFELLFYYIDTPVIQLAKKEYLEAATKSLGVSV